MQTVAERFEEEENQAVLRDRLLVAFAGTGAANWETLDQFNWQAVHPVGGGAVPLGVPASGLGDLEILPEEVIQIFVQSLDPGTMVSFRAVNRRALGAVESNQLWRRMDDEARGVLVAAIRLQVRGAGLCDLFAALCSTQCSCCDEYGGLLYLTTADRVCWSCLVNRVAFWPLTYTTAAQYLGWSVGRVLNTLPSQEMLTGFWGPFDLPAPAWDPTFLVDREAVRRELGVDDLPLQGLQWRTVRFVWSTVITGPILAPNEPARDMVYCWACSREADNMPTDLLYHETWHRQFDPRHFEEHMREDHPDDFWQLALELFPWAERPWGE